LSNQHYQSVDFKGGKRFSRGLLGKESEKKGHPKLLDGLLEEIFIED
jgi:hypothetical protein